MDADKLTRLRQWAVWHHKVDLLQARWVLELLDENATLKRLNEGLAERVAKQSELLSKNAEKAG